MKGRGNPKRSQVKPEIASPLRIIGGYLRGRPIRYHGDPVTRPMKERVREAVFSILGPQAVRGTTVIDLFAGTGALALEAISRGAARGMVIERNFAVADLLRQNIQELGLEADIEVIAGDAFIWGQRLEVPASAPWLVFCSPPYKFYRDHLAPLLELMTHLHQRAPGQSTLVVEADSGFDFGRLPQADAWSHRDYLPARLAWLRKT